MLKNTSIFIINGKTTFAHAKGELNQSLVDTAIEVMQQANIETKTTTIQNGYSKKEEVDKYLWADIIIYQSPIWWMGLPWLVKKYLDDVFTFGYSKLYKNDGRTRDDKSKKYGSGGLMLNKKYMLSVTCNTPLEALEDKDQFFEGVGIDTLLLNVHKANQFLGMQKIPTFMCNDVVKNPDVKANITNYIQHLKENIIL